MLKRIIAVLILIALVSSLALADGMQGYSAKLNKKIATRTGPSRSYDEPGTFFISNWASQTVTVYTKAYRDGVWWVLVDFAERGHPYRLYTGASRVEIDLSMIPEEKPIGTFSLGWNNDITGYYGPGTNYTGIKKAVPKGASGDVYAVEKGYVWIDFFDSESNKQRRAWVRSDLVSVTLNYTPPTNNTGNMFHGKTENRDTVTVKIKNVAGQYSYVDIFFYRLADLENVPVFMADNNHGTFSITRDNIYYYGEIWFTQTGLVMDFFSSFNLFNMGGGLNYSL